MIIYKATNIINGKCYIGLSSQTLERRVQQHWYDTQHKQSNIYFHNALRKHDISSFVWEVICECETVEEMYEMEFHYIKQYNTRKPGGYNLSDGGDGSHGYKMTDDNKKSISDGRKGKGTGKNNAMSNPEYRKMAGEKKKKWCKFVSPTGEIFHHKGIGEFCTMKNLHPAMMARVLYGAIPHYKGWTAEYIKEDPVTS